MDSEEVKAQDARYRAGLSTNGRSALDWFMKAPLLLREEARRIVRRCRQPCSCEHPWDCPLVWQFKKEVENEAS